jgi:hypothetical protein
MVKQVFTNLGLKTVQVGEVRISFELLASMLFLIHFLKSLR